MVEKNKKADRARQFLPFDSLSGFYQLVKEQEKRIEVRRELAEDELEKLSYKYNQLVKGKIVKITYYDIDGYVEKEGMISDIDNIYRTITIITTKISLNDICNIEASWLKEYEND